MNKQKELWEKLARENPKYYINSDKGRGITDQEFRESGKDTYKKYLSDDKIIIGKSKSILDLGCGTGRLTEFMAHDFKKVVGIDISATMIVEGKERLKEFKNIELLETDGSTIPLPDESIDSVFSYLVFQHIKTREMVESNFKEIYRILKPEGVFKVLLRSDKQKDMNRWWSGVEYNEESIGDLYRKIGFRLLKIEHQDKYAFWMWLIKNG
jgi:ubiquinone/menaquinone biosynthesis C-methylase UbiE